jgi:hypothetical protein
MLMSSSALGGESQSSGITLHFPREVTVKDKNVRVGDIAVISGNSELAAKVTRVAVGTIAKPGQAVTFDRQTIMTRLGSDGIDVSALALTGSDKVTVTLARSLITSAELLASAEKLASRNPIPADQRLHAMDMPEDVNLSGKSGKLDIVASLAGKQDESPLKIKVAVMLEGKTVAERQVRFVQVPRSARAAAAQSAGKPAEAVDAPKVVFRNQPVVIEIDSEYLKVTATGLPLEDGKAGQIIKVRNIDSKRDIIARVRADGTVAPVL